MRDTNLGVDTDAILSLPIQNHTGDTLATELNVAMDAEWGAGIYVATFSQRSLKLTVTSNDGDRTFKLYTDAELSVGLGWTGPAYDTNNPMAVNDVIRNVIISPSSVASYSTEPVDLIRFQNLYITSPNLGSFTTLGPRGESNIIKKIPVTADYGYMIHDSVVVNHDWINVSKQQLKLLEFKITDAYGNVVDIRGIRVSLSLIFMIQDDI